MTHKINVAYIEYRYLDINNIKELNDLGLYGAITGKAIYANTLSLEEAIKVTKGEK